MAKTSLGRQQCSECGYTLKDAILHGDHRICKTKAPWADLLHAARGEEYEEALAAAEEGTPYGWEEDL